MRKYSVSVKKETNFFVLRLTFRNFAVKIENYKDIDDEKDAYLNARPAGSGVEHRAW
jgi:hypothetical protein